jgi:D-alanyl-D-alanine-carboxypeptidase/D-alanyl-D-alanine-endopeptidase
VFILAVGYHAADQIGDMMPPRRLALIVVVMIAADVRAQSPADAERQRLTSIVQPMLDAGQLRSAAIGLIDATGRRAYGFGHLSAAANSPAPDGDTVYEIASVTKTFTATLLAEMVERKEVALDDPVAKFLPGSIKLPATDQPITLLSIATHHSGLPRMPSNFRPRDPANPYADYTVENLYAFLPAANVHPTATFEYSNVAYGLLGHALSRRAKQSYEELIVSRVAKPLGMNDTRITLTPELRTRLAPPFDAKLKPAHLWDFGAIPAGGAIRSTANDMLKYLAAQLDLPPANAVPETLRRAIAATHTPRTDAGANMRIGLAWHISRAGILWHNGQTGGYHSFVAFNEKAQAGVVLLTNTASMDVDKLGNEALKMLLRGEKNE